MSLDAEHPVFKSLPGWVELCDEWQAMNDRYEALSSSLRNVDIRNQQLHADYQETCRTSLDPVQSPAYES